MTEDDDPTRRDMRRLLAVVKEVRKRHPRMELGQLEILLSVFAEPGLWAKDLTDKVGLKKSALSRNVRSLTLPSVIDAEGGPTPAGAALITQIPDPFESRAMQLSPTKQGWIFAKQLSDKMEG